MLNGTPLESKYEHRTVYLLKSCGRCSSLEIHTTNDVGLCENTILASELGKGRLTHVLLFKATPRVSKQTSSGSSGHKHNNCLCLLNVTPYAAHTSLAAPQLSEARRMPPREETTFLVLDLELGQRRHWAGLGYVISTEATLCEAGVVKGSCQLARDALSKAVCDYLLLALHWWFHMYCNYTMRS